MLSYRQRERDYKHMSSIIKNTYFKDTNQYQILYKANYSKENGLGNLISYDDITPKLYDISVNRNFTDTFNIVLQQIEKRNY